MLSFQRNRCPPSITPWVMLPDCIPGVSLGRLMLDCSGRWKPPEENERSWAPHETHACAYFSYAEL
jgi:hypothetical protein